MHLSDEEEEFSHDSSDNDSDNNQETTNKRKNKTKTLGPLKKIKYEDITTEKQDKKTKNELYKPPTVEELNELKETQNLYNNNLFRLQIEELIKEVRIKNKHQKTFTNWYHSFQEFLNELPEHNILLSEIKPKTKQKTETDKLIDSIANKNMKSDQDFTLKLIKPEGSELFGLNTINALPGPKLITKINLKIPRVCFNVKDYLNNRYFVKRYYFLAYIHYYLKQKNLGEITWTLHNHNNLLPILQVQLNDKIIIKIIATPTENYFRPSRFSAELNNVKTNNLGVFPLPDIPTIYYNSSLAHDVTLTLNNLFQKEILAELPNIQEAIKLISVWLTQRELNLGQGAFTDDLIIYFILYLYLKKRINKHMSSYQIIRNFWNFFHESDLSEKGISLAEDTKDEIFEIFHQNFDIVFLDRSGFYNVTAFLNLEIYKKIQFECGVAFKLLDDGGINCFHSLFITKLPTELQYDLILTLQSKSNFKNIEEKMDDETRTKFLGFPHLFIVKYIQEMLRKGLNKRITLVVPLLAESRKNKISFGINLDSTHAFNILELGPALNDPKEKEFREFWGELSTDRRFKDGSVCVAVYFKTETIKERREIIKVIIDWISRNKLNLQYNLHYNEFEEFLVNKKIKASYPMGTNEECSLKTISASDELAKKLRSLEMPLSITGVQGISDTFSMTDVFPPISTNYRIGGKITTTRENNIIVNETKSTVIPRLVKPMECVLQLEHSSKWPKNLETLRYMKTAFYLEIAKLLSKKYKLVSSVKPDFFDVLYEGYVFRYHLYLLREIGLLKQESTNNGVATYKETPESRELEMKLNILPKLVGTLKGIQSQFPSFGPTTALIKRWLRSQLIDDYHFPDNAINLLSASLYLNQSAFPVPNTPQIGFLRFLKFFAEFQWQIQPVIVNFNDEITKETVTEIDSKLLQNRDSYPNLFLATPYDGCESLFTKVAPSKEVLRRVKQLSKEALLHVTKIFREESLIPINTLFVPNLEGYDLIIRLRSSANPARHERIITDESQEQINLKKFIPAESKKIPIVGFNPVQCYLRELRSNYGDFANFFHNCYGGDVIGVLWIPKALESKEFKVSYVNGRKLKDGKLILNIDALIEDFYVLGKDIVKSIDVKK